MSEVAPETSSEWQGVGLFTRMALRTNRWFYLVWVFALGVIMPATLSKYDSIMTPATKAETAASLANNITMRAMLGPVFDLLNPGPFVMWRVGTFVAAAAAIMATLGVIRATRDQEESGRLELMRAGAVGRHAPLAGALLAALLACGALGVIIIATMPHEQQGASAWSGAIAAGVGIALTGAMWAAIGALAAQLSDTGRGARSLALSALGAAYLLRATADAATPDSTTSKLGWLSPVEWAALVRPYVGERWWVLGLSLGLCVVVLAAALVAASRRDFDSGVFPARLGPASSRLHSASGLLWRLERTSVIGWVVGITAASLTMGTLVTGISQLLQDNPALEQMFQRMGGGQSQLEDAFYVAMLSIMTTIISLPSVQVITRLRAEETSGRTEAVLATAISRMRWLGVAVAGALLLPLVLCTLIGAGLAVTPWRQGDAGQFSSLIGAAWGLLPGIWILVGVAVLLLGWLPRLLWVLWVVIGWSTLVIWLGALLELPDWMQKLTPWARLPHLPGEAWTWGAPLVHVALAAVLIALGMIGYRRRGIPQG